MLRRWREMIFPDLPAHTASQQTDARTKDLHQSAGCRRPQMAVTPAWCAVGAKAVCNRYPRFARSCGVLYERQAPRCKRWRFEEAVWGWQLPRPQGTAKRGCRHDRERVMSDMRHWPRVPITIPIPAPQGLSLDETEQACLRSVNTLWAEQKVPVVAWGDDLDGTELRIPPRIGNDRSEADLGRSAQLAPAPLSRGSGPLCRRVGQQLQGPRRPSSGPSRSASAGARSTTRMPSIERLTGSLAPREHPLRKK